MVYDSQLTKGGEFVPGHSKEPVIITHVKIIENLASKYGDLHLKEIGLTQSQANIILLLAHQQERRFNQRDIERALNLTNPTVSGLLSRMEQKGFIVRSADPLDSRVRVVLLTEEAVQLVDQIYDRINETERKLLEGLTAEEERVISRLMRRIAENAVRSC